MDSPGPDFLWFLGAWVGMCFGAVALAIVASLIRDWLQRRKETSK